MSQDGVRRRPIGEEQDNTRQAASAKPGSSAIRVSGEKTATSQADTDFGVLDVLRMLAGLLLLSCLLSYFVTNDSFLWGWRPWFVRPALVVRYLKGPITLTDASLQAYDGSDPGMPIYLALNGTIYDVTAGARLYGPGGGYQVFAGRDAARGFITGCFAEDGTPDLRGAEWTYVPADVPGWGEPATAIQKAYRERELRKARKQVQATIEGWASMFRGDTGRDYFEVGTVRREEGWLADLPGRELCEQAQRARPKPKEEARDPGAMYRDGR